jgi:hypothetical protein
MPINHVDTDDEMEGTFELRTPQDLLEKLRFDLRELGNDPTNSYLAFNFFVTAEHMKGWIFPGKSNKSVREDLEKSSILLQVCSHVANGSKHFQVEAKHHRSVVGTAKTGGYWGSRYWASNYWSRKYFAKGALIIVLQGDAEQQLGATINALDLALRVVEFWAQRPEFASR